MSSTTPVWLLDVDGVINAVATDPDGSVWPRSVWERHAVTVSDGVAWPVLVASPVIDFLWAVHESGAAEIRWHTTWQHDAPNLLAPTLGLPDFPVQETEEFFKGINGLGVSTVPNVGPWWKLGAALHVANTEGRRLIWTDDDLHVESWRPNGLGGMALGGHPAGNTLLLSPQVRLGLTKKHLKAIAAFCGREDLVTW